MTFFVGYTGSIRLQRGGENLFSAVVMPDDVNTVLNRFSFEGSDDNLITGDLVELSTQDPRGLAFISPSGWPGGGGQFFNDFRGYINVNAAGGIRLFTEFEDAVNNDRTKEFTFVTFSGDPIELDVGVRDTKTNNLGSITSFEINTDRAALETTSLTDKFKQQYSAGLLSGNGSIECLFSYEGLDNEETPLFLLQVINRLDVGSNFKALLSLTSTEPSPGVTNNIYYDIEAVVSRAGVTVNADALVACSIDFVTTGEFRLRVGVPPEYVLKEDGDLINLERSLDYLLKETTD
jgi:hypothetical protein